MGYEWPRQHHPGQPDCGRQGPSDGRGDAARARDSERVGGPVPAAPPQWPPGSGNFTVFTKDLLEQIVPTVEKNFRVYTDPDHRAIGGLSMGAMQSVSIGLSHPELFHYVLAYSGGFGGPGPATGGADIETQSPWKDVLADPEGTKKWLRLLFLGCGQQETGMLGPGQRLVKPFKENGVNAQWADHPGGHVFSVWRNHLNETAPMLFRMRSSSKSGKGL